MLSSRSCQKRFDEQCAALSNSEERHVEISFLNVIYIYTSPESTYLCMLYVYIPVLELVVFLDSLKLLGSYDWLRYINDGEKSPTPCAVEIGAKVIETWRSFYLFWTLLVL